MIDIWAALAAPLPKSKIDWRIDGKVSNGQARFVCYIDAHTVRERLDATVPGLWTSKITREPEAHDKNGVVTYVYHCSITISGADDDGVTRDDVGEGESPKIAATDAFKRAAVRFGIGAELYAMGTNYVPCDEKGRPTVDPQENYERKQGKPVTLAQAARILDAVPVVEAAPNKAESHWKPMPPDVGEVPCPKCGGRTWDNRVGKRNPKAPDFKCRDKSCDGCVWPPKNGAAPASKVVQQDDEPYTTALSRALDEDEASLPF